MSDFALVTFAQPNEMAAAEPNLFRRVLAALKKPRYEFKNERVELYRNVSAYIIKLPFSMDKLPSLNMTGISKAIAGLCKKNAIADCFLPRELDGVLKIDGCSKVGAYGRLLYKSLILDIIYKIYSGKNIEISELDIVVVQGARKEELYSVIRLLSPMVKYITVITDDKGKIEDEINRFYIDFGISIGVTTDYKGGLRNADLIINLGDSKEHIFNPVINPKALVLNFGNLNVNKLLSENPLINGIEVSVPERILAKLGREVHQHYDIRELSEIVLFHRFYNGDSSVNAFNYRLAKKVSEEFKKDGCNISGFVGRRRVLKIDDIPVYTGKERKKKGL